MTNLSSTTAPVAEAAATVAAAITGPGTPEAAHAVAREDALTVWMRNLSGPAVSVLLMTCVAVLALGGVGLAVPWAAGWTLGPVWTPVSEGARAWGVVGVTGVLAVALCLICWRANGIRVSRVQVSAGPAGVTLESGEPTEGRS